MRKYVVGMIIGAVLMMSGQAVAGTISSVGKKIQGEYTVIVNGKAIRTKAIAVDGTTFTPNAAIADAMDAEVVFQNKTVVFTTDKTDQLNVVNGEIEGLMKIIEWSRTSLEQDDFPNEEVRQKNVDQLKELEAKLAELEAKKAELLAQP